MTKLWLDDVREPELIGWTWAKTAEVAIDILMDGEVSEASFDHDLCGELDGNDLIKMMLDALPPSKWPSKITIHSHNKNGADNMYSKLMGAAPRFVEVVIKRFEKGK